MSYGAATMRAGEVKAGKREEKGGATRALPRAGPRLYVCASAASDDFVIRMFRACCSYALLRRAQRMRDDRGLRRAVRRDRGQLRSVAVRGRFGCRLVASHAGAWSFYRPPPPGRPPYGVAPTESRRGRLPIARCRRRRSTPAPGAASSRAPTDAPGAARPSGRTPIYSGRAASASSRRSRHSRAAGAVADGDRAAVPAARSPGDRDKAACRARGSVRAAGIPAVLAGPKRYAASRRWPRRRRSVRWRATTSVDSSRVLLYVIGSAVH